MKAAILHGPRDLQIVDQPLETDHLKSDEIWVKTEITGFKIGTDRGNYEGAVNVPEAPGYPRGVGDSNVGTVQGVGSAVTHLKVGDRVASREQHQSEWVSNDANQNIVKVPDGVDSEDAVWAHLYTLSGLCYHKAYFKPGENVAVIGLGVLGLGAVALGPLFGARVVGLANSELRMEMAQRMGAHATFMSDDPDLEAKLDKFTGGRGIDLVIETANPWPAYRTAVEIVRPNGRVAVVALLGRGEPPLDFNPLDMKWFYGKAISIIAISQLAGTIFPTSDLSEQWRRGCEHLLALMADGKLQPSKLITHRLHYTEMQKAYEMAYHREKTMLGVTFDWRDA